MFDTISELLRTYIPLKIEVTDIVEIIIISFMIYELLRWVKATRAWQLVKGLIVILIFIAIAALFNLTTILWIAGSAVNIGLTAIVIIFQPELRKALEQLGRKEFLKGIFPDNVETNERFSDRAVEELVKATYEMAKVKTGALIVIEQDISLVDYERTGIALDSLISSQLIINIFEHNTPLHDGAVIMRGNRLTAATCYLPLSDNMELSKELGTRHRAAVGISEVTDSFTIVVSEETGAVSIAVGGRIFSNIDGDKLKAHLIRLQNKQIDVKKFRLWKVRNDKVRSLNAQEENENKKKEQESQRQNRKKKNKNNRS